MALETSEMCMTQAGHARADLTDEEIREFRRLHTALAQDELRAVSRELHDEVAQSIAAGLNLMELGEQYYRNGDLTTARKKWNDAKQIIRRALEMTKQLALQLRAPRGRSSAPGGPGVGFDRRPSYDEHREEIFLILREAIDNAMKHSGADHIVIQLRAVPGRLTASAEDDGGGVPGECVRSPLSLGLQSMRERAALLGGTFSLISRPSAGTRVVLSVPMSRAEG